MKKTILLGLLVGGFVGAWAHAAEFHVTTAQQLQNALTAAAVNGADDSILLAAGTYAGNFNFNSSESRGLTIRGEQGVDRSGIIFDGAGLGRALTLVCSTAATFRVSGITVRRNCGLASRAGLHLSTVGAGVMVDDCRFESPTNTYGLGLAVASAGLVTVSNCVVTGNCAADCGGGVSISGAKQSVAIVDCTVTDNGQMNVGGPGVLIDGAPSVALAGNTFTNNHSAGGSGALGYGAAYLRHCTTVTFSGNVFRGNSSSGNYGSGGGGAYFEYCTNTTLTGNTFDSNTAWNYWGGAVCFDQGHSATLIGNVFSNNTCHGMGGGAVALFYPAHATLVNNVFSQNNISWGKGGGVDVGATATATLTGNSFIFNAAFAGGGAHVSAPAVVVSGNRFTDNRVDGAAGGGLAMVNAKMVDVSGNTFRHNYVTNGSGGGLCADMTTGTLKLRNNLFSLNRQEGTGSGGGLWLRCATNFLVNNTVTGNAAANGGGVYFQVDGVTEKLQVFNNVLWGNTALGNGGDVFLAGTGSRRELRNNDVHSLYGVWDVAQDNLDTAPGFADSPNADYHLQGGSPCVDTGNNAAPMLPFGDLRGALRVLDGNNDGTAAADIGCYEYIHPSAAPDIALSGAIVAENQAAGTELGALCTVDPAAGDTHAYSLVGGTGSADNASFAIRGDTLQTAAAFDFETRSSHSVRIRTTDSSGRTFEKAFIITVSDVNEPPTDIALSTPTVQENQPAGTAVGMLSATDPDAGNTHTYALVGGADNTFFVINGMALQTAATFDFETRSSYSVRVRSTDQGGLTCEKVLVVTVTDVNEPPTDIALSNAAVAENQAAGTVVGTLSATDPDAGNTHTYALVSGAGSSGNASFVISGSTLQTAASLNFEARSSYSVRIRATDQGGLSFDKVLAIRVTDVDDVLVVVLAQQVGSGPAGLYPVDVDGTVGALDPLFASLSGGWVTRDLDEDVLLMQQGDGGQAYIVPLNQAGDPVLAQARKISSAMPGLVAVAVDGRRILAQLGAGGPGFLANFDDQWQMGALTRINRATAGLLLRSLDGNHLLVQAAPAGAGYIWRMGLDGAVLSVVQIYNGAVPGVLLRSVSGRNVLLQLQDGGPAFIAVFDQDWNLTGVKPLSASASGWVFRALD